MFDKKKVIEIIKLIPPFLVFIGTLRLILFYNAFNINIVNYIEFPEFLLSFFDSFILLISCVVLPFAIIIGLWGHDIGKENNESFKLHCEESFNERLKKDLKSFVFIINIIILIATIILLILNRFSIYKVVILLYFPILNLIFFFFREIRIAHYKATKEIFSATYTNSLVFFIIITFLTIQLVVIDIEEIKSNHKYLNSKIILDDSIIISNKEQTYIGKTNNYIFIYQYPTNSSKAIPISRVKEIEIISKY